MHEGPQGAPEDPLPASTRVTVGVEESHRRAIILSPAGLAAPLQPHADPQKEQQEDKGQNQAQVEAWHQQRPQQPTEGRKKEDWQCVTLKTSSTQDNYSSVTIVTTGQATVNLLLLLITLMTSQLAAN